MIGVIEAVPIVHVVIGAAIVCRAMPSVRDQIVDRHGSVDTLVFTVVCLLVVVIWPILFLKSLDAS